MNDDYISREEVLNLLDTAFESGAFDGRYAYENLIDAVQNLIHPLETDLISRQAVESTLYNLGLGDEENGGVEYKCALADVKEELKNIPSIEPEKCGDCMTVEEYRAKLIETFHKADHDELIALVALPIEKDFEHLEWLLKTHYGNREKCGDCISRQAVIDRINKLIEVEKKQGTDDWGYGRERVNAYEAMLHMVESEYLYPSVEPERKPGKWINVDGTTNSADCSCCGNRGRAWMLYCYMCGSKMEVDG